MNKKDDVLYSSTFYTISFATPIMYSVIMWFSFRATTFSTEKEMEHYYTLVVLLSAAIIVVNLASILLDRKQLQWADLFCPHWFWILIQPVYMWKRVMRNGMKVRWFWLYAFLNLFYVGLLGEILPAEN